MRQRKIFKLSDGLNYSDVIKNDKVSEEDIFEYPINDKVFIVVPFIYKFNRGKDEYLPNVFEDLSKHKKEKRFAIFYKINHKEKEYTYVATEGDCRPFIVTEKFDKDFAIKTVLSKENLYFKQINKTDARTSDKMLTQKQKTTKISSFNLDSTKEVLRSFRGTLKIKEKKLSISANLGIEYNSSGVFDDLLLEIEEHHKDYLSNNYQKDFPEIDYIKQIRDKDFLDTLILELADDIWNGSIVSDVSWPQYISSNIVKYKITKNSKNSVDYLDNDILNFLKEIDFKKEEKIKYLKTATIEAITPDGEKDLYEKLINCISFECKVGGNDYFLSEGIWYQIDQDFIKETNEKYNKLKTMISNIEMPVWNKDIKNEDEYNKQVEKSSEDFFNMDKILTEIKGHDRFEIADTIDINKKIFITTKKCTNSSNISHLVTQARIIQNIVKFNPELVNEKLKSIDDKLFNFDAEEVENIVLAIASKKKYNDTELPYIPFLARTSIVSLFEEDEKGNRKIMYKLKWIKLNSISDNK